MTLAISVTYFYFPDTWNEIVKKETQQLYFAKQNYCTATFIGTIRKGETVAVFDVVNERDGGMVRYKIDSHKNPTWLYESNFNDLNC